MHGFGVIPYSLQNSSNLAVNMAGSLLRRGFSTNCFRLSITISFGTPPISSNASSKKDSRF